MEDLAYAITAAARKGGAGVKPAKRPTISADRIPRRGTTNIGVSGQPKRLMTLTQVVKKIRSATPMTPTSFPFNRRETARK
jgi:hypothetical protein